MDILVSNTTDAIACLATRFKHTRVKCSSTVKRVARPLKCSSTVTGLPPAQLHFEVMVRFKSVVMVRFNLYGAHSSPAALDPTWAEGVRRRSVWVLSPAGFAYRRQSPADECAMRRDTGDSRLSACA